MLPRQKPIYENCRVLDKTGALIFRCARKRLDWYLGRGLATELEKDTIRLNFECKGIGRQDEPFYLQDMQDKCVNCGVTTNLTLHHVVPHRYRKWFPESLKSHSSHDLLPLCIACHDKYESGAIALTKHLAECFSAPLEGRGWIFRPKVHAAKKAVSALQHSYDKIPEPRRSDLVKIVHSSLDGAIKDGLIDDGGLVGSYDLYHPDELISSPVVQQMMALEDRSRGPEFVEHGQIIAQILGGDRSNGAELAFSGCQKCLNLKAEGFEGLIGVWRRHFIDTLQPKHLPQFW